MRQKSTRMPIIWLVIVLMFVSGFIVGRVTQPLQEPLTYTVIDKAEEADRFFIQTWIEVSPEKYIGLDIGDEFEQ